MDREEQIIKIGAQFAIDETDGQTSGKAASMRGVLLSAFKAGAEWADQHPHWIPVEEELPKETGWYLVATPTLNSKIDVAFWDGKWRRLVTITHWMPIVPPRKEE